MTTLISSRYESELARLRSENLELKGALCRLLEITPPEMTEIVEVVADALGERNDHG